MKYKQANIIQAFENGEINVLMHQCNCTVGMGAGIAKKIAEKYPVVNIMDKGLIGRRTLAGTCYPVNLGGKYIVNLYSQYYVGSPTNKPLPIEREVLYDNFNQRKKWLRLALQQYVNEYSDKKDIIGLPLIASGLAADRKLKGSMTDLQYFKEYVAPIVEEELKNLDITIYYL